jgi:purine-binding chemotaxis protein CheW
VDGVDDVLNIASDDIEETPDFGTLLNAEFLLGLAKAKGKVIALLDIDRALAPGLFEKISHNLATH